MYDQAAVAVCIHLKISNLFLLLLITSFCDKLKQSALLCHDYFVKHFEQLAHGKFISSVQCTDYKLSEKGLFAIWHLKKELPLKTSEYHQQHTVVG